MPETPHLFRPLTMRQLTVPNRIVVSPMHQYCAADGVPTDWHFQHLVGLSASGPGLVMAEVTSVEPQGRITPQCAGLYSDEAEHAFARIVASAKRIGLAKIGLQISHAGRKGSHTEPWNGDRPLSTDDPNSWSMISASPSPYAPGWPAPRAAEASDLARIRQAFASAALRADRAGFDVLEIHAAHGYLLHQFLSPIANDRGDDYGGSLDNRMRFPLSVLRAVRNAWPPEKPMGIRISVTDWLDGGFGPDDAVPFAAAAKAEGIDYVCVSSGGIVPESAAPPLLGHHVEFAGRIRRTGIVTRVAGMIVEPRQADAILAEGKADLVALGRAFLDDPRWAWHAADALGAPVGCPPQYLRARPDLWPGYALRSATASP